MLPITEILKDLLSAEGQFGPFTSFHKLITFSLRETLSAGTVIFIRTVTIDFMIITAM